jgi:hypothetical protein
MVVIVQGITSILLIGVRLALAVGISDIGFRPFTFIVSNDD